MNAFFEALYRASAFGLAALFVALIAQTLLGGRVPAAWRAWIWRIALLQSAFALLPLAPIRWEILASPPVATPSVIAKPNEFPVAENLPPLEIPDAMPLESAPPVPIANSPQKPFDWRAIVLAIYVLGVAFQLAQLARGKRQLRRILRSCTSSKDAILTARLQKLADKLNLQTAPQLLLSERGSPFLTGVWRPQIVLPRTLCEAEQSQLDAILAHELAHQKRRDLVWLGATWLVQTLLWFHPLAWAARRFHGLETECACDELALQLAPIAPQSYGALLLNSMNNSKFSSPLAAGTCDTLFALKTRLLRLNRAPRTPHKMAKFAFVSALLLSCGALVPLKLVARAGDATTTPEVVGSAVVQGVVTSKQTKKPLARVKVMLMRSLSGNKPSDKFNPDFKTRQEVLTDNRGYFRFNATSGKHFLGVDAEVITAPKSTRFSAKSMTVITLKSITVLNLKSGQKQDFKFDLTGNAVVQGVVYSKKTRETFVGVPVILLDGNAKMTPKRAALADISGYQETKTDARGYFRFNVSGGVHTILIDGEITVDEGKVSDFSAQQIYVFTLKGTEMRNSGYELDKTRASALAAATPPVAEANAESASGQIVDENKRLQTMNDKTRALIGKAAPEIQETHWANGKMMSLQSLRGKVVLLIFDNFAGGNQKLWNDLARRKAGRLQIVGVQINSVGLMRTKAIINKIAAESAFPIALDALRGNGNGNVWSDPTFHDYGLGITGERGYAIIGRDGKISKAGDNLAEAFEFADRYL